MKKSGFLFHLSTEDHANVSNNTGKSTLNCFFFLSECKHSQYQHILLANSSHRSQCCSIVFSSKQDQSRTSPSICLLWVIQGCCCVRSAYPDSITSLQPNKSKLHISYINANESRKGKQTCILKYFNHMLITWLPCALGKIEAVWVNILAPYTTSLFHGRDGTALKGDQATIITVLAVPATFGYISTLSLSLHQYWLKNTIAESDRG